MWRRCFHNGKWQHRPRSHTFDSRINTSYPLWGEIFASSMYKCVFFMYICETHAHPVIHIYACINIHARTHTYRQIYIWHACEWMHTWMWMCKQACMSVRGTSTHTHVTWVHTKGRYIHGSDLWSRGWDSMRGCCVWDRGEQMWRDTHWVSVCFLRALWSRFPLKSDAAILQQPWPVAKVTPREPKGSRRREEMCPGVQNWIKNTEYKLGKPQ